MKRLISIALLFLIAASACKKGDKGDPGAAGQNGLNGTNGSGKIQTTEFIRILEGQWGGPFPGETRFDYSASLNTPIITQGILDSGLVTVYARSNSVYYTLPANIDLNDIFYDLKVGSVILRCKSNISKPDIEVRIVTIQN